MRPKPVPTTSASGYDLRPLSTAQRDQLAAKLSPEERRVLLHQGTEAPFCGTLLNNKKDGINACRLSGQPLFKADAKFESGTCWPSFTAPFEADHVAELVDESHGMIRTEIRCRRCDSHLGHVFDDGPRPTRRRYCLNSVSMEFFPTGTEPEQKVSG